MSKRKCYLYNFPTLAKSERVREPSILYVVPDNKKWHSEFVFDNEIKEDGDLYLCSVFTCGYPDFLEFSKKIGRKRIIVGGYHPSLCPKDFLGYASKIVVGFGNNIDEIIESEGEGIIKGKLKFNYMDRSVFPLNKLKEAWYADIFPGQKFFSINTFLGCPFPCDFADNCYVFSTYGKRKIFYPLDYLKDEIKILNQYQYDNLCIRDEGFFIHPQFKEIVKLLSKTNKRIYSISEIEGVISEDIVKFLKANNWFYLTFGFNIKEKYTKNRELVRVIELAHKYGLNIHFSLIISEPPKDRADDYFENILKILFKYMPTSIELYFWTPYPGTKSFKKYRQKLGKNDYERLRDGVPKFQNRKSADCYRKKLANLQIKYYQSKEYAKMRNFNCGDNLNLFISKLEKNF